MKEIIRELVREEAKYWCDSCGEECFSELTFNAWYGSKHDLTKFSCHLCDECLDRIKEEIEKAFGFFFKKENVLI